MTAFVILLKSEGGAQNFVIGATLKVIDPCVPSRYLDDSPSRRYCAKCEVLAAA